MILTCPACDTKYVVKDGAIPPAGRQVRCAACKHSWHQDPEPAAEEASPDSFDLGGPPPPAMEAEPPMAEVPPAAEAEGEIAGEPQPNPGEAEESPWGTVAAEPAGSASTVDASSPGEVAMEEAPAIADEWRGTVAPPEPAPPVEEAEAPAEEGFAGYAPIADDYDEPKRRWPLILGILLLIAAAAAAFWYFAPPEWKARAGIAQAETPLEVMITRSDRQPLASGNELVSISGRVINPTDRELAVPPIQAELRDIQTKAVVYRWTISPPTRVLPPHSSANFNSAELDVPRGNHELFLDW